MTLISADRNKFDSFRVHILFSRSWANQFAGFITASAYSLYAYSKDGSSFWIWWALSYTAVFVVRVLTHRWYFSVRKKRPELQNPLFFERLLTFGNFVIGCFWAAAAAELLPEADFEDVIFLSFVLAGNTAAAAVGYCASARAAASFIFPSLVPLMLILFLDGRAFFLSMGWLLALYLVVNTLLFLNLHRHILDTIALRFEKDRLVSELVEAQRKAVYAEKMAALGEMSGGIAHEINNPLAIIQLANDQIQKKLEATPLDSAFILKLSQRIGATVQRMSRIVESLRVFSRDGAQDLHEVFAVSKLVEDTVVLCAEKFKGARVALKINSFTGAELEIRGNQVQVSQVLLNLLNNAFDAVKDQSDGEVVVGWRAHEGKIEILVTDNGSGIAPEIAGKIFQPFFSTKQVGQGTGLGLSISLGIMQAHSGQLMFESLKRGTTFIMRLPAPEELLST